MVIQTKGGWRGICKSLRGRYFRGEDTVGSVCWYVEFVGYGGARQSGSGRRFASDLFDEFGVTGEVVSDGLVRLPPEVR